MNKIFELAEVFARQGKEVYLVGGSVRDFLLGRASPDIDLTTNATPVQVKSLIGQLKPDAVYTVGEKFGTVGLIFDGQRVEITTYRSECYNPKSRKPIVQFGISLEEDLARRDFTINAMAREILSGKLIDPFGGLADLRARLVRAVGVPDERFEEDPLRLLRGVRFAVELDFTIETQTAAAIARAAKSLQYISWERIGDEMNKIMLSPAPGRGVRLLCDLGLAAHVMPEMLAMRGMTQDRRRYKDVFEHTLLVTDRLPSILSLRWAGLLHDIGKPATIGWEDGEVHFKGHERVGEEMARQILARLRLDARTIESVSTLIRLHTRVNQYTPDWTDGAVRRFIREVGDELEQSFALSRADVTSQRAARVEAATSRLSDLERRCHELLEREAVQKLASPLDGNELMAMFQRKPGPWIGRIKDHLLNLVLEGELAPDDKERAAEIARELVAAMEEGA